GDPSLAVASERREPRPAAEVLVGDRREHRRRRALENDAKRFLFEDEAARSALHDHAPGRIHLEIERLRLRDDETVIRERLRAEPHAISVGGMGLYQRW